MAQIGESVIINGTNKYGVVLANCYMISGGREVWDGRVWVRYWEPRTSCYVEAKINAGKLTAITSVSYTQKVVNKDDKHYQKAYMQACIDMAIQTLDDEWLKILATGQTEAAEGGAE